VTRDSLLDKHLPSVARKALLDAPSRLNVSSVGLKAFHATFGIHWHEALAANRGKLFVPVLLFHVEHFMGALHSSLCIT
jgi:hypothetical protein